MKESSYANAESASHKRIRLDKVMRLARFHGLGDHDTQALVAAWEAMPESAWNKAHAKPWAERNAQRSKARGYDRMKDRLAGLVALLLVDSPAPEKLCNCSFDDSTVCELCDALKELGLKGFTTRDQVLAELASLQEKLENTGKDANGG